MLYLIATHVKYNCYSYKTTINFNIGDTNTNFYQVAFILCAPTLLSPKLYLKISRINNVSLF